MCPFFVCVYFGSMYTKDEMSSSNIQFRITFGCFKVVDWIIYINCATVFNGILAIDCHVPPVLFTEFSSRGQKRSKCSKVLQSLKFNGNWSGLEQRSVCMSHTSVSISASLVPFKAFSISQCRQTWPLIELYAALLCFPSQWQNDKIAQPTVAS